VKKARLTLEIARPVRWQLKRLVEETNAESMTEVIRRALSLYEAVLNADKVVLKKKDGSEETLLIV
jgi:hypothetical protein